jgi:hypothetical protein
MSIWLRIIVAVIFVAAISYVIPPIFRIIGFPLSADMQIIIRVCVAALALYYIISGKPALGA